MKAVTFGMACPAIAGKIYLQPLSKSHKYVRTLDVLNNHCLCLVYAINVFCSV